MKTADRRTFLKQLGRLGAIATGLSCVQALSADTDELPHNLPPLAHLPANKPIARQAKSIVARAIDPMILTGTKLHENALLTLIEKGLRLATDSATATQAWQGLLKPDDVIGIKFDAGCFSTLGTGVPFAAQLVKSLEQAGFDRQNMVLIDVPVPLARELKTRPRRFGWQMNETSFGSGSERLAAVLDQITAMINVPFLRTDNLSGICGCIKNGSLPFVMRQSRYFSNGCSPFLADILALPQIQGKLRLHLINGLRGIYANSAFGHGNQRWPFAGILVSTDPVAADSVALDVINTQRATVKLPPLGDSRGQLAHIHAGVERSLGTDDQDYIHILKPSGI